jgi:hypothetical protein
MEIEKETILLMSKGDKKAYETMFRRFYPKVHRFVAMLLKNEDDADDVSQLIFLKVWNKREKFADIQDFDSYLCRVSGGSFTLPSLGTVLDSLPSHGSSYLTLLFISLYSLLT